MSATPQQDWSAIRAAYEQTADALAAIARRHQTSQRTIRRRAVAEGWMLRPPQRKPGSKAQNKPAAHARTADTPEDRLIRKVYRALARNLDLMERRMTTEEHPNAADTERDMRAIGAVVKTVEKVKEIEAENASTDAGGRGRGYRHPLDGNAADAKRRQLAERLARLRERKQP